MSYANPIDTRIVQVVLDDLQDNNITLSVNCWLMGLFPTAVFEDVPGVQGHRGFSAQE
jgi:hypothetical protein